LKASHGWRLGPGLTGRIPRRDLARERGPNRLNSGIGNADASIYTLYRGQWRNPELTVTSDRVELRGAGESTIISVADIEAALVDLPVSAWPYGRVSRVTTQCLFPSPSEIAERAVNRNSGIVARTLTALGVLVEALRAHERMAQLRR
jgi:hypothetical protein